MNIGLIAHDAKKILMQNFCVAYHDALGKHTLYATGTTGALIEAATGLSVNKLLTGHLGGEMQLCSMIEHDQIDAVIFLRDPEIHKRNDPVPQNILQLCDQIPIPIATNLASAELLIREIEHGDMEWREA
jgi:methylglyoxal synthase